MKEHKGVTLIELLIVIAVIVILSSVLILSTLDTAGTADSAKIIANLTTIRKAALSWYVDNREKVKAMKQSIQSKGDYVSDIEKYIGGNIKLNEWGGGELPQGGYGIFSGEGHDKIWYAGYRFTADEEALKGKLEGRAKSLGLHFTEKKPNPEDTSGKNNTVWMHILGDI